MYTFSGSSRTPVGATTGYSTANPVTGSITVNPSDTLLVLMLLNAGADRLGGAPNFGGNTMLQADTVRSGLTSPEISAEMWYITASGINSPTITGSEVSVPNTGGDRICFDMVTAYSAPGKTSMLQVATGSAVAVSSTNPYCRITTTAGSTIIFEVVADGANSWASTGRTAIFTNINDNDIGNYGGGMMYSITNTVGIITGSWIFGTGEDWGVVMAAFGEKNAVIYLNNANHSLTSDEVVITAHEPTVILSPNSAQQTQIVDGDLSLYQNYILVSVGNTEQLQTADNVVLTYHAPSFSLTVDNSTNSQSSDTVVLIQHQILITDNSTQAQTAENTILTVHAPSWSLTLSDAIQLQSASNVDLVQAGAIGAQGSTHAQFSDALTLTQHQLLTANSTTHLQTSGNIDLSQSGAIGIQNVIQAQFADNVILTQHFVLVMLIATQLITSNNVSLSGGGVVPVKMIHYMRLRSK